MPPTEAPVEGQEPGVHCKYVDGSFTKMVKLGDTLARQTLNDRCVKCFECKDSGMQCAKTASG